MESKVMSLSQAISRFVSDGMSIVMGTALEALIPFAAGYEIVRQGKKGLNLIGPISDILFDILIGAGCVRKITAAWVGNVIAGSGYNLRRAVEQGIPHKIEMEDHTNFTLCLALHAGALGLPFLPTRTALGSDLFKTNRDLQVISCPFTGQRLTAVKALKPDLAIIQVQRADEEGNSHVWGHSGITEDAVLASTGAIVIAEELVPPEVIRADPSRTLVTGFNVQAVVHLPYGSHPSPVQGFLHRDHNFFLEYHEGTKTVSDFEAWLKKWVLEAKDHRGYLNLLGGERLEGLKVKKYAFAPPVNYGY